MAGGFKLSKFYFDEDDNEKDFIIDDIEEKKIKKEENIKDLSGNSFKNFLESKKLKPKELEEKVKKYAEENDERAFEEVLSHMHGYLTYLMNSDLYIQGSDSEDIYQEGAIKLMNVIKKYDPQKGSFTSFAQSSIRKHIITAINKEQAKKRSILNNSHSLHAEITNKNGNTAIFIDELKDDKNDGEYFFNALIERDYEEYLVNEISQVLSHMESQVFYKRFIDRMSYKEIAVDLNMTRLDERTGKTVPDQKSVDNAIWRSRPKIRKVLEKLGIGPKYLDEKFRIFSDGFEFDDEFDDFEKIFINDIIFCISDHDRIVCYNGNIIFENGEVLTWQL